MSTRWGTCAVCGGGIVERFTSRIRQIPPDPLTSRTLGRPGEGSRGRFGDGRGSGAGRGTRPSTVPLTPAEGGR